MLAKIIITLGSYRLAFRFGDLNTLKGKMSEKKKVKKTKKFKQKTEKLGETQARYTPDVDKVEGPVYCGVCGEKMTVKRNVHGWRTFMSAMGGNPNSKSNYDVFQCPVSEEDWHKQVVKLRDRARNESSSKLEAILREEAEEVLKTKVATKKVYF